MDFSKLLLKLNSDEDRAKLANFLGLPQTSFVVRAINDEMKEERIVAGDYVFINPLLKPTDGSIVLANNDGIVVLRRYVVTPHSRYLTCDDRDCKDIDLGENPRVEVLGVATGYLHPFEFNQPESGGLNFQQN
ncbi:MAG TPA: S24 family peptidase [Patescibacteria group bacterium]|nr:S24 family peptidase [Patescibacteria group bacterium]